MRPIKRALRRRMRAKNGRIKKERGGGGGGEDEGKKKAGREKNQ